MKHRLRPLLLAIASVALPGLGHAAVGRRRAAALFLVPTLLIGGTLLAWAVTNGTYVVAATLVTPSALTLLFAANIMVAGWRTSAAVDAVGNADPGRLGAALAGLVIVLAVAVPHVIAADTIMAAASFLDDTFAGIGQVDQVDQGDTETPMPDPTEPPDATEPPAAASPGPSASSGPTPSPSPVIPPFPSDGGNGTLPAFGAAVPWQRPGAIPWGDDGRFDLLLIGSDAGSGRWSRRNDVMLLVEVDVGTGATAMIGLPRNLQNAPYPPGPARDASACGCQPGLLNEMYVEATVRNPGLWPGKGAVKGIGAVRSVVHTITGRPIDAVLIVDLAGVIRVVDAMGGIDIDVPEAVVDDHYPDPGNGEIKLRIKAGPQHFDGHMALAYARSRHMDSDYGRMDRQQTLLLAIRQQLGPEVILNAPALFGAARGTAWTDLPRESLPALIELFGKAADAKVKQLRIVPPRYPSLMTAAWINQVRDDIANLLPDTPEPQHISVPRPVATPRPTAPPTPRPTPRPTKGSTPPPTSGPTAEPTPDPTAEPAPS